MKNFLKQKSINQFYKIYGEPVKLDGIELLRKAIEYFNDKCEYENQNKSINELLKEYNKYLNENGNFE